MDRTAMIALVDNLYAATAAGDWDRVATMLTDDFRVVEPDCLPLAGDYPGVEGLREVFGKLTSLCDVAGIDRIADATDEDLVICLIRIRFADPAHEPAEVCELFRLRDGKCCEIKPYYFDHLVLTRATQ